MSHLTEIFVTELKDLYDAEKQITEALPKLAEAAENGELRSAFENHLTETEGQIGRLEEVFEIFDEEPRRKKCKGMEGLLEEGEEMIDDEEGDAGLIAAAQKVEHYEIAAYGTLITWAKLLGKNDAAKLLEQSLHEEKAADEKLTEVAQSAVNAAAIQ